MGIHDDYARWRLLDIYGNAQQLMGEIIIDTAKDAHDECEHPPLTADMVTFIAEKVRPELEEQILRFEIAYDNLNPDSAEMHAIAHALEAVADRADMALDGAWPARDADFDLGQL